jgi:hypothetical protein
MVCGLGLRQISFDEKHELGVAERFGIRPRMLEFVGYMAKTDVVSKERWGRNGVSDFL